MRNKQNKNKNETLNDCLTRLNNIPTTKYEHIKPQIKSNQEKINYK